MFGLILSLVGIVQSPTECFNADAGVRAVKGEGGFYTDTYYAKDAAGKMRLILAAPTYGKLGIHSQTKTTHLLQTGSEGLFESTPSFGFTEVSRDQHALTFLAKGDGYQIEKKVDVPSQGSLLKVTVTCNFTKPNPVIRFLLDTYAFAPDGKGMSSYKRPDATFAPAIRPRSDGVIGDHFFRAPVVTVQKGSLAASIMPNLDVLKDNRYIPTILDLNCSSGVADAPLMSYGFCDQRLVGHVYFANDSSMTKPVPPQLLFSHDILLDAQAVPFSAYQKAAKFEWDRYGHGYLDKILPQAMPFAEYAKVCYPAALNEKETGGWFETTIDGKVCGGMPSGWGRESGWVSWQPWFNQLRSAWGLRWWGQKLGNQDWVSKSNKMLNLALAAPMDHGAVPTTYLSKERGWKGSLITPDPKCFFDLTNMAWKGIWMLRWLEFPDCPRKDEILRQCREMAKLMVEKQNADGSIPTWLGPDLKVVPVLDHSAQTALPVWFLANLSAFPSNNLSAGDKTKMDAAVQEGASFLAKQVVPGQYWYDFETFFSCSPKVCFQRDAIQGHEQMRDPYTLQAPQNTLCMHWAAEALMSASKLAKSPADKEAFKHSSLMALDTMTFYQNVWPISYRKTAYTYGGFGVQNSDGEYNDARQAQFGDTLADFGAELGRKDYFERGVAAARASLTLINHPLHEKFGIYPNPNYPLGLEPENDCHGGSDHQAGRTGPDWGEMSGLTSMAWLLDKYGPNYKGTIVDGGTPTMAPDPAQLVDPTFDMKDWRMPGWTFDGTVLHWPVSNPRRFNWNNGGLPFIGTCEDGKGGFDDELTGTIDSPLFKTTRSKIRLKVGGGAGPGVYVALFANGEEAAMARGHESETMDEVVWDVSKLRGKTLQIRAVDKETGGWGHINFGNIRCSDN
jgi:hypothetical protein